jgi:predicted nuclease of predicted toxin-antitoxin system
VKFKLDENLSPTLAKHFESSGHEAHSVVAQSLGGQSDERVIEVCLRERRALITLDLDFSNIQAYPPNQYPGIVVLRITNQSHPQVEAAVRRVVALLPNEKLAGTLWIVEDHRVRIRV